MKTTNQQQQNHCLKKGATVFIDFSLTVKVATLIFIPGRGSAIPSAYKEKSGSIYNLVKNFQKLFGSCKRACIS